jgi:hypothetical protein
MTLATEELGETPDVNAATMDEILSSDAFGKFAILSRSKREFIQAGNDWQPDKKTTAFLEKHDSDPWVLEYHKGKKHFRAEGHVTLDRLRAAFRSYLEGGSVWQTGFVWNEIEL